MKRDSDKDKYYIVRHLLHFRSLHKFASKGDFYPLKRGGAISADPEASGDPRGQCSHVIQVSQVSGCHHFYIQSLFPWVLARLIIQTFLKLYHS